MVATRLMLSASASGKASNAWDLGLEKALVNTFEIPLISFLNALFVQQAACYMAGAM